jgi:tetratricopeptide (TPR) repeat protein
MPALFTCVQGHSWEVLSDDSLVSSGRRSVCPVCGGESQTVAANPTDPDIDSSKTIPPDADAQQLLLAQADTGRPGDSDKTSARPAPVIAGYEILGELGRGGMAVVYKARQEGLNRLVALKMILSGSHAGQLEVARFRLEAEAVARLQHPNIVQIYEIGEADGFPFLSLEFVDGGSLTERLNGTPLSLQVAAGLVQTLALAVHYAHQHGIVHRDLKPANILLSGEWGVESGESPPGSRLLIPHSSLPTPKITDFGLAKPAKGDSGLTRSGTILGTPSYMAPEQAESRSVGPPADIYALGAILYETLTGRPPFRAETHLDTIMQVITDEPVPPSRLNPKLSVDLETICLKCLEKEPQKRYESAKLLAEDLGRFLADEPILARPTGPLRRAVKWAKRRPALAGLVAVSSLALLVLAVVIAVSNVRLTEQRDYALEQKALADEQRDAATKAKEQAQASFERARAAVDQMLTRVGDQKLKNVPLLEELQRDLLEEALKFNQQFLQDRSTDPAVRRETGRAYYRAGGIRSLLGQHAESATAYREGIELQQELAHGGNGEPADRRDLAQSYQALGAEFVDMVRYSEAEQAYKRAHGLLADLTARFPKEPSYRQALAGLYNQEGRLYSVIPRWDEVEPCYRQALALQEELVAGFPKIASYRQNRAVTQENLGIYLSTRVHPPKEADPALRKAIEYYQELARDFPKEADYRVGLAQAYSNLGSFSGESGRMNDAEEALGKAIVLYKELVADFPRVPGYRRSLAMCYGNMGILRIQNARSPEAVSSCRQAVALYEQVAVESPKAPGCREDLANALNNLASTLADSGQKAEAEKTYQRAVALLEPIVAEFPTRAAFANLLGQVLHNMGELVMDRNALPEARALFERAIRHQSSAVKINSKRRWARMLSSDYVGLAEVLLRQNDHAAAVRQADDLARLYPKEWEEAYNSACILSRSAPLAEKDSRLSEVKRRELSRSYADRAIERLRTAVQKGFKDAEGLKKDKDFEPVRNREDFKKIARDLETKTKGK